MYAVVRELFYDVTKLTNASQQLQEFQRLHKEQPGYLGNLTVEVTPGHQIVINIWQSEAQSNAGRERLGPAVHRLQEPLMSAPSRLVGAGPVVSNDLIKS